MSDQKHDRFRRLERPRTAGPDEAAVQPGTETRIEAVEGPGQGAPAAAVDARSGGELGRFRAPPERTLELDRPGDDAQPFRRCAQCETDNFRTAARCTTCGADLDTEPQRQFNRRFWAARQAQAAAEAEADAARRASLEAEATEEAALRRRSAEAMAREVGDSERRRLEREGFGPGWTGSDVGDLIGGAGRPVPPFLFRVLGSLPPGWAVPAGLALLALPVGLYVIWPAAGLVTGAVLVVLCLPARRRSWFETWFDR